MFILHQVIDRYLPIHNIESNDNNFLQTQFFEVRTAAALDQRDLARFAHEHFQFVPSGRRTVCAAAVRRRPVSALRRISSFPLRQRGGPHRG